jgi:uncharacterized protein YbjT (DUF2867 family)
MSEKANDQVILLTGASGYVGGRLRRRLESRSYRVRCLARRPEVLIPRVDERTEVRRGDVLEPESLSESMEDVSTAYYLVHSMGASSFEERDREGARNFAAAAGAAGVRRIIYLGGLGSDGEALSPHLRSRNEVGEILRSSGVPTIEFRASIVLGSGSLSFELIRSLVETLPVMVIPRWVGVLAQPIAIDDLLDYLVAALDLPGDGSRIFEIGGADRVSYGDLMREYARQRGVRRLMIPVPVLTPYLSSLWLGLVTPLYARIGKKLIESIENPTVIQDDSALAAFPIRPCGMRAAVASALHNEEQEFAETRWYDAFSSSKGEGRRGTVRFRNRLLDSRSCSVDVPPAEAFRAIREIGGENGWYAYDWLWKLRGFVDLLLGGVGVRRGRPHPSSLTVGDAVDFWRVETYEPDHLLRLAAEMKVPGRAWLEFEVLPEGSGSTIRQTAVFDPRGLSGLAYWYALYPIHRAVFSGMLRGIAEASAQVAVRKPLPTSAGSS